MPSHTMNLARSSLRRSLLLRRPCLSLSALDAALWRPYSSASASASSASASASATTSTSASEKRKLNVPIDYNASS